MAHRCKDKHILVFMWRFSSLLLSCRFQGLNLNYETWWKALLSTGPSH